jgi:hypothetical protein
MHTGVPATIGSVAAANAVLQYQRFARLPLQRLYCLSGGRRGRAILLVDVPVVVLVAPPRLARSKLALANPSQALHIALLV